MSRHQSSPAVLLCVAVLIGVVGCEARAGSLSSTHSPTVGETVRQRPHLPAKGAGAFDVRSPEVSRLEPALLSALEDAADDAAGDGVVLHLTSGWRSAAQQQQLFEQAVLDHGSESEAEKWVARPGTSVHETGGAVDIGPEAAWAWLGEHGASYGLCRIYDNEPWHYELRPDAVDEGCPATYADPSEDPRTQ